MSDINPIQFGEMLQEVRQLRTELTDARAHMKILSDRLGYVEDRYKVGKAAAFGAVMVLASAIYGVKDIFGRIIGSIAP